MPEPAKIVVVVRHHYEGNREKAQEGIKHWASAVNRHALVRQPTSVISDQSEKITEAKTSSPPSST